MMELPSRDDLLKISQEQGNYCVSIYMPTARKGVETLQGSVRLKNLLRQAEKRMMEIGASAEKVEKQLAAARAMTDEYEFFQHQSDSLALLIGPDGTMRQFRMPIPMDEHVHVNHRFHIKPLMQVLTSNGTFFLLAASRKKVRLMAGDKFGLREINLPEGTPRSLDEAMKFEDWGRGHHFSPGGQGRNAGGIQAFAGHGADASDQENEQRDMLQFLQMVNKGISEIISKSSAPLIIAGLEAVHPIAREALTYPHVCSEKGITRNVDELRTDELHALAWQIAEPLFHREQDEVVDRFNEFKTKGLASSNLAEVIPAAAEGRVESLILPINEHCWGTFDTNTRQVQIKKDEASANGEDLLDLAAVQALTHGACVYAVGQSEMPGNATVAAVYRY